MNGIVGKKIGMIQMLLDQKTIPATVIEVGPCYVVGIRSKEKDGYSGVQLAYDEKKNANVNQGKNIRYDSH